MTICDHSWQVSKGSINFPARDIKNTSRPPPTCRPPDGSFEETATKSLSHLVFGFGGLSSLSLSCLWPLSFGLLSSFTLIFFFLAQSCAWNASRESKVTEDDFQTYTLRFTEGVKCSVGLCFLYLIGSNETELNFISDCWLNRRKSSGCIGPVSKSITIIKEYLKQTHP